MKSTGSASQITIFLINLGSSVITKMTCNTHLLYVQLYLKDFPRAEFRANNFNIKVCLVLFADSTMFIC